MQSTQKCTQNTPAFILGQHLQCTLLSLHLTCSTHILVFSLISAAGVENSRGRQDRRGSLRPSCDAEFAKALKVFYHSMTSVRGQLQRLRRHKPSEEADLLGLRMFVDEHAYLLKDFAEQLEQCVTTLKQDVAAIVRRKREKSGIWS
ncbi:kinesin-like protein KIF28P [Myxocyprinus asiaticus]|uniref:kinesin-like protein KIF28P n=1 Tax=Myxocyprinus asiaticus TaxID=70543 RepID=UPI0022231F3F|nr:kinesin-like protein KIF28P [Myxocyprinus asiaticus]